MTTVCLKTDFRGNTTLFLAFSPIFLHTDFMIICPAQPFDIFSIMNIERQSFIPAIQEKKRIFEKRLKIFPEGFLLLADCSDEVILKNKTAFVCGYLCSELWSEEESKDIFGTISALKESGSSEKEQKSALKRIEKRFSLGHNPLLTHKTSGSLLYISSFAILKKYRGKGLGEKFFQNSVAALCSAMPHIKKVVVLVNSDWEAALKIYKNLDFEKILSLKEFFPTIQKKINADGLIMTADANLFKSVEFAQSENEFGAIKI